MSRTISASVLTSMMAQESSEGYVILLTIDHATLASPIRVASSNANFVSNGETYFPYPFQVDLPSDDPEQTNTVELKIDNLDGVITAGVRAIPPGTAQPSVTMEVVTMDAPNTVEVGPLTLSLTSVSITRLVVSGTLAYEPILDRQYPSGRMTPLDFPGMF